MGAIYMTFYTNKIALKKMLWETKWERRENTWALRCDLSTEGLF